MRHCEIIEALAVRLGSQQDLADRLGVHDSRLSKWKRRGIPPRHWASLLRIAQRQRLRLTLGQLDHGAPRPRRRRLNGSA